MSVDTLEFRKALGSFVTGVTIVTTRSADGTDVGLTANSFNSVSLDPPMVLWSLARTAASREAFEQAAYFAVHVLASDQEALSQRFAKRGEDKFAGLPIARGEGGVALIADCAARFVCRTAYQYDGGDHIIFVGEVQTFDHIDKRPLAFHAGRYAVAANRSFPLPPCGVQAENDGSFSEDFLGYLLGRAHHQFYTKIRQHMAGLGLNEAEHYLLSVLINGDGRSVEGIDSILAYTGVRVTPPLVESLLARGLLSVSERSSEAKLWLTSQGRQLMIEATAVAKSMEADVEKCFNEDELRALKQLLKCTISATDPGVPDIWAR